MRIGGGEIDGRERNLAADEIDHRRRAAAIGLFRLPQTSTGFY